MEMLVRPASATNEVVDEIGTAAGDLGNAVADAAPRIVAAIVILLIGHVVGLLVRRLARGALQDRHTPSFVTVMSKVAGGIVVAVAIIIALTVIFPSVKPVDLLAGAGLFSIAIGFAFRDIFENLLAGVLLLFRQPFESGDQVEVEGAEGTVDSITIRETRIRTYDGQLKIVPNSDVYKNAIRVQTAEEKRRVEFVVGVAYEDDLDLARDTIRDALAATDGVYGDPAPEALLTELAASTVNIRARFWCDSRQLDSLEALDRGIAAVKVALDDAGVQLPTDIVTIAGTKSLTAALRDGGPELTPSGSIVSQNADSRE